LIDVSLDRDVAPHAFPAKKEAMPSRVRLLDAIRTGRAGSHLLVVAFDQGVSWNMLSDDLVDRVEATVLARLQRIAGEQAVYRGSRNTFIVLLDTLNDASAVSTAESLA